MKLSKIIIFLFVLGVSQTIKLLKNEDEDVDVDEASVKDDADVAIFS